MRIRTMLIIAALVAAALPLQVAAQQETRLTFWSWRVEDKWAYDEMIKVFESKNPGIRIEFTPFRATEYNTVLSTAMQAGRGPDIIHLRAYGGLEEYAAPGFLVSLDERVPELRNFSPSVLIGARSRRDGHLYGVPFATQTLVIFYNTKIFQRFNLKEPRAWDEFITVLRALKDRGVIPLANGAKEGWTLEIVMGVLAPNFYGGNDFFNKVMRGDTTFKDPRFTEALGKMLELRPYMPQGFMGVAYADMQQLFINEQAAMFVGGIWELGFFQKQNPNLQLDVMRGPAPRVDTVPLVSNFADGNYGINARTRYTDAAVKFIRFTATREFGQMFHDKLKQLSAVPGVQIKDPILKKVQRWDQHSTPYVMLVGFRWQAPTGSTLIQSALQGMLADRLTPAQVGDI
ncbi:MAG: extracellular solute-binding protein, partial [Armatimonadetes bacterium]|nr:extracellular solute-binding protein [Armatimonadota bacterium]